MYSFRNDYSEIAHKKILEYLVKFSNEQNVGYGMDSHSANARKLIRKHIDHDIDIDVRFLIGGTSCNKIAISHVLKPYEAVISATTGHINVHETGAIEATGHKVITVQSVDGKILPKDITTICKEHIDEHMVVPKMVYISNATETGSIYTKSELEAIEKVCRINNLYLYIDGARLGVALMAEGNDLTLNDIANLSDMFYIGGTKNGAMFGEALVIVNDDLKTNFRHSIKQNGGLLAKGFITGMQFEVLFTDNLYFDLAKHANEMAKLLKNELTKLNIKFYSNSPTNQQFIHLSNAVITELQKNFDFEIWTKQNNSSVIRLVTTWATKPEDINIFINQLKPLL